ncbi:MAG: transglutaminase domain-containing protein [Caldithrix sp.]|nr:transglutaminase domain-containing protein [Caldithrix sp.]
MKSYQRILPLILIIVFGCGESDRMTYHEWIDKGEFKKARQTINQILDKSKTLTDAERDSLLFQLERMNRIEKDFTKTEQDVLQYIRQYIPEATQRDMRRWEKNKALEMMKIDGQKRYFNYAGRNLFRIDEKCKQIWQEHNASDKPNLAESFDLDGHIREVMTQAKRTGKKYVNPVRLRINYSIEVPADNVPDGETVKCWIPFPRHIKNRQTDIEIVKTQPENYQLAPEEQLQRTIYFEQKARSGYSTRFSVSYEYTQHGVYVPIEPNKIVAVDTGDVRLKPFLQERHPHIVFTEELKSLSDSIVGDEENPYRIAQKLFKWVDNHIPWASAREYSSIQNLSMYPYIHRHGDCGIQTMLFITLCRINGIPARWQSGWEFKPPDDTMHDWGMIYFEPYGWTPMDVTYGMRDIPDEKLKWFYLHGMDSYRLIFNDDFSRPFSPVKTHFRSETVDSQRGEVEWSGGNLYFDQWKWNMDFEVLSN